MSSQNGMEERAIINVENCLTSTVGKDDNRRGTVGSKSCRKSVKKVTNEGRSNRKNQDKNVAKDLACASTATQDKKARSEKRKNAYLMLTTKESCEERRERLDKAKAATNRRRANETPEQRAKRLEKLRLAKQLRKANATAEEREERLHEGRMAKRCRRENESPEEKALRLEKNRLAKRKRRAGETALERKKRLEKRRLKKRQKSNQVKQKRLERKPHDSRTLKKETTEEREKRLKKQRISNRRRLARETPRQKEKRLENQRSLNKRRISNETEEERENRLSKYRLAYLKRKNNAENRQKRKFYQIIATMNMTEEKREQQRKWTYFYRQANKERLKRANLSEEHRQKQREVYNNWLQGLSPEKRERRAESVAKALKKYQRKRMAEMKEDPERWKQFQQQRSEYQRQRYANETPEQKLRRRRKDMVNLAKARLRKKLEQEGTSPEEIQGQLKALGERMWRGYYPEGDVAPPGKRGPAKKVVKPPVGSEDLSTQYLSEVVCLIQSEVVTTTVENYCISSDAAFSEVYRDYSPPPSNLRDTEEPEEQSYVAPTPIPELVECSHCSQNFTTDGELRSHVLLCHPEKCWNCPKCVEVLLSPTELSQHFKAVHNTENKATEKPVVGGNFVCMKCSFKTVKQFETRSDLFSHVRKKHRKCYWPCEVCQLLKYSEEALHLHRRVCRPFPKT